MERLTKRVGSAIVTKATIKELGKKLAELEDMEEQGRLVKLPCKVGDTVYYIHASMWQNKHDKWETRREIKAKPFVYGMLDWIDTPIYLTREEVDKRLMEVRNG